MTETRSARYLISRACQACLILSLGIAPWTMGKYQYETLSLEIWHAANWDQEVVQLAVEKPSSLDLTRQRNDASFLWVDGHLVPLRDTCTATSYHWWENDSLYLAPGAEPSRLASAARVELQWSTTPSWLSAAWLLVWIGLAGCGIGFQPVISGASQKEISDMTGWKPIPRLTGWKPILLLLVLVGAWFVTPLVGWVWFDGYQPIVLAIRYGLELLPAWLLAVCISLRLTAHGEAKARLWLSKASVGVCLLAMALSYSNYVAWGVPRPVIVDQHPYSAPFGAAVGQSDARQYEAGAIAMMESGKLPEWNARRPINTSWMLTRLWAGFGEPVHALWWNMVATGLAIGVLMREMALWKGFRPACVTGILCWGMARFFIATHLSETLGLALGAWGAGLFIRGWRQRSGSWWGLLGLAILTLAQAARPGAVFTLPLLGLAWGIQNVESEKSHVWLRRVGRIALAAIVVLAMLSINPILNRLYGTDNNSTGSNFSSTIAGLASGSSWREVELEFEHELAQLPNERERAGFLYEVAWQRVRARPTLFLKQSLKGIVVFAYETPLALTASLIRDGIGRNWLVMAGFAIAWCVIALKVGWRLFQIELNARWAILATIIGILMSVPIVYLDGGVRVLVGTWPLLFVVIGLAFSDRSYDSEVQPKADVVSNGRCLKRAVPELCVFGGVLLVLLLAPWWICLHRRTEFKMADQSLLQVGSELVVVPHQIGPLVKMQGNYDRQQFARDVQIGGLPCGEVFLNSLDSVPVAFTSIVEEKELRPWYLFLPEGADVVSGREVRLQVIGVSPPTAIVQHRL